MTVISNPFDFWVLANFCTVCTIKLYNRISPGEIGPVSDVSLPEFVDRVKSLCESERGFGIGGAPDEN